MSRETCSASVAAKAGAFLAREISRCDASSANHDTENAARVADMQTVKEAILGLATAAPHVSAPTLLLVARHFCITPRTLQRRLREHGTTFRQLLNEVRFELATEQLEGSATVTHAAEAVGFSEPSCFHRAFKRWTGQTPKSFRTGGAVES